MSKNRRRYQMALNGSSGAASTAWSRGVTPVPFLVHGGAVPPNWIFLALASACFLGLYDVAKKLAVDSSSAVIVLFQSSLAGLLSLCPFFVFGEKLSGWQHGGLTVESMSNAEHCLVLLKAALVSTSWVCSFVAIKHLPISLAVPVRASSPLFTVAGALLLFDERLEPTQWAAVLFIFLGYFGLSRVGKREGILFQSNRYLLLLILATLIGAASGLYDKYLIKREDIPPTTLQFWFSFYNVVLQALIAAVWIQSGRLNVAVLLRPQKWAIAVGLLLVVADQFYFRALFEPGALVSVVSMVRRSNVILSFALGGWVLREALLRQKALMLILILAGVAVLLLG